MSANGRPDSAGAATRAIGVAVVVVGLASLAAFGVVGIGRGNYLEHSNFDMQYLRAAGRDWLAGLDPYDAGGYSERALRLDAFGAYTFAYPPHIAPLCALLAAVPLSAAKLIMTGLNLACVAWTAVACGRAAGPDDAGRGGALSRWAVFAFALGNPFVTHVVWMGQTSLLATAALAGCWIAVRHGRTLVAGALLGVAMIKPQLALLPVLWMLLDRQWRVLLTAGGAVLLLAAVPMLAQGPVNVWMSWLRAVSGYRGDPAAAIEFRHTFGLRSALATCGVSVPSLAALAVVAVVLLHRVRERIRHEEVLGLLLSSAVLLVYAHDYDLAFLGLLSVGVARRLRGTALVAALVAAAVLCFPQRYLVAAGHVEWSRTREVALLAVTFLVAVRASRGAAAG